MSKYVHLPSRKSKKLSYSSYYSQKTEIINQRSLFKHLWQLLLKDISAMESHYVDYLQSRVRRLATRSNASHSLSLCVAAAIFLYLITTTQGAPYSPRFWSRVRRCDEPVRSGCAYMSLYCNPRIFSKRSIDAQTLKPFMPEDHVIEKRSTRRRFHVTCRLCRSYCW